MGLIRFISDNQYSVSRQDARSPSPHIPLKRQAEDLFHRNLPEKAFKSNQTLPKDSCGAHKRQSYFKVFCYVPKPPIWSSTNTGLQSVT